MYEINTNTEFNLLEPDYFVLFVVDKRVEDIYIPMILATKDDLDRPIVSRRTILYHPLVRFRAADLPPAFFFAEDKPPGKLTSCGLVAQTNIFKLLAVS